MTDQTQPAVRTVSLRRTEFGTYEATNERGGTLLLTPLRGADGHVYAVAQGPISLGGFSASSKGGGDSAQKNQKAVGRVPAGARVERAVEVSFDASHELSYALRDDHADQFLCDVDVRALDLALQNSESAHRYSGLKGRMERVNPSPAEKGRQTI